MGSYTSRAIGRFSDVAYATINHYRRNEVVSCLAILILWLAWITDPLMLSCTARRRVFAERLALARKA